MTTSMTLAQANTEISVFAQGRITIKFDASHKGGTYYTYDSFTGPGKAVVGSFTEAVNRVKRLYGNMSRDAMWVEAALSDELGADNYI